MLAFGGQLGWDIMGNVGHASGRFQCMRIGNIMPSSFRDLEYTCSVGWYQGRTQLLQAVQIELRRRKSAHTHISPSPISVICDYSLVGGPSLAESALLRHVEEVEADTMCRVLSASATPIVLANQSGLRQWRPAHFHVASSPRSPFPPSDLINSIRSLLYSHTSTPSSRLSGLIPLPPQLGTRGSQIPRKHKEICSVYGAGYQSFSSCRSHRRQCGMNKRY
jgi:hypothetical protein